MARNILAELSVILKDGVSGKAKEVVNSLGKIEKAADKLGKSGKGNGALNQTADALNRINKAAIDLAKSGQRMGDWGAAFERRIIKIGASAADIDRLKSSWRALNAELNKVGAKGAFRTDALRAWKSDALSSLLAVRVGADGASRSMHRLGNSARAARRELSTISNLTRTLGFGGAAYAGQIGIRAGAKAAAEYHRETAARQVNAGIAPQDRLSLQTRAMTLSGQYRSVGATGLNELGRALYNMTGSMPKALDLMEDFTKAWVVLQTNKGPEKAAQELETFSKAIDILGRQDRPEEVRQLLDMAVKAQQVEGNQLPLTEYFKLAKYAKSAGAALSPRFLGLIGPSLLQEEGGQRTGTALGSTIAQLIAGRSTKAAKAAQAQAGVLGKNGVVDPQLLMSDPDLWAYKHLGPAMQKQGFDPYAEGNEAEVTKFMNKIMSNQMVAGLFTKLFTQAPQYKRNAEILYPQAKGLSSAATAPQQDPFVALMGVQEQLKNFAALLGEAGITNAIIMGLNGISGAISKLNEVLADDQGTAQVAAGLLGVAAALTAIRTALAGWALISGFMPGKNGGAPGAPGMPGAPAGPGGFWPGVAGTLRNGLLAGALTWAGTKGIDWLFSGRKKELEDKGYQAPSTGVLDTLKRLLSPITPGASEGTKSLYQQKRDSLGINPKVDTQDLDNAQQKAKETQGALDQIGTPRKAAVDSSDVQRVLQLAREANAELDKLTQKASNAANAIQNKLTQQTRAAMRSLYSDLGTSEAG